MTQIIHPYFERRKIHKLRLLRSNPMLYKHPEFANVKPESLIPLALLAGLGFAIMLTVVARK
jgi:hypothetical protein